MKFLVTTIALFCATLTAQAQDPNFYIYLAIGQSNMVGQAQPTAKDSVVSERFLNLTASDCDTHTTGQWRKAVPPLARQWTKLCPVDYFGRTMLQNLPSDKRVGSIIVAVDGCAIDVFHPDYDDAWVAKDLPDWQRNEVNCYGGKPLERLLTLARKAQADGVIKGILLHQGETDAYNDTWLQKVKGLYEYLLRELKLEAADCPIIVGETVDSTYNGVCAHAIPTIDRLPQWIPTGYVVSSKGCPPMDDNVHFSRDGYITLGKRYAYAALKHMGIKANDETSYVNAAASQFAVSHKIWKNKQGKNLRIKSEKKIKRLDIVSYSGQTIYTYQTGMVPHTDQLLPVRDYNFKLKDIKDKVLIIVIEAQDGTKSTKKIEL